MLVMVLLTKSLTYSQKCEDIIIQFLKTATGKRKYTESNNSEPRKKKICKVSHV